jgi:hypothetical protein
MSDVGWLCDSHIGFLCTLSCFGAKKKTECGILEELHKKNDIFDRCHMMARTRRGARSVSSRRRKIYQRYLVCQSSGFAKFGFALFCM